MLFVYTAGVFEIVQILPAKLTLVSSQTFKMYAAGTRQTELDKSISRFTNTDSREKIAKDKITEEG